uniref:Uncharacterized protein n=1 Tax=Cacopsylla melanoneura TaxID=428564 RepID=A0A8D9AHP8_9HEMI
MPWYLKARKRLCSLSTGTWYKASDRSIVASMSPGRRKAGIRKWFISLNRRSFRKEFNRVRLKIGRGMPFDFNRMNMCERNPEGVEVGEMIPFPNISLIAIDIALDTEVMSGGGIAV